MPTQTINYQGINRAISDYASPAMCEELINLRPTTAGLVPVKPFSVKMNDKKFGKVFTHHTGSGDNFIAIERDNALNTVKILHVSAYGTTLSELVSISSETLQPESVNVAETGNILFFSICDKDNATFKNIEFLWDGTTYIEKEANIPDVSVGFSLGMPQGAYTEDIVQDDSEFGGKTDTEWYDLISTSLNEFQVKHITYCTGPIILAVVLKYSDGKSRITTRFIPVDMSYDIKQSTPTYRTKEECEADCPQERQQYYSHGGYVSGSIIPLQPTNIYKFLFYGVEITAFVSLSSGWNSETSLLKSVEIYTTVPKYYIDISKARSTFFKPQEYPTLFVLPAADYREMELDNQLFYLQKTITLEELQNNQNVSFKLEFGGTEQLVNKTMEVDSGTIRRFGKLLSYNSRYHFYNSADSITLFMPGFSQGDTSDTTNIYAFAKYKDDYGEEERYLGTVTGTPYPHIIVSSHLNIIEVDLYYYSSVNNRWELAEYPMTPSSRYNYSVFAGYDPPTLAYFQEDVPYYRSKINAGVKDVVTREDNGAEMNVSEQYNPFAFNPKHSYLFPGSILNIQPQMVAVRDVSFGDYPLNVFTTMGTYALLQGDGTVLYGASRQISDLVAQGDSHICIPTDKGTFFLAAGGLWAIAGATTVLVSDALSRGPNRSIRDCTQYKKIANGDSSVQNNYDVSKYESAVPFDEYASNASLAYNRFRDEIIISNPDFEYSYVLSLKYHQWFKISQALSQNTIGDRLAIVPVDGYARSVFLWAGGVNKAVLTVAFPPETYSFTYNDNSPSPAEMEASLQEQIDDSPLEGVTLSISAIDPPDFAIELLFPSFYNRQVRRLSVTLTTYNGDTVLQTVDVPVGFRYDVNDMSEEEDNASRLFHLQSRPFSLGSQYTHIHRVVDYIRTNLVTTSNKAIVALYGSDDLQNWTLLTYAARIGTLAGLKLSQIRTAPAARSWRYYTVCIGGNIPADSDLGPVLIDHEPVIRRIG